MVVVRAAERGTQAPWFECGGLVVKAEDWIKGRGGNCRVYKLG